MTDKTLSRQSDGCELCGGSIARNGVEDHKSPSGLTICSKCYEMLNAPVMFATDCFYCGEDFLYRSSEPVPTYNDKPACDACRVALKENENPCAMRCEYCHQVICVDEGDVIPKTPVGYVVCKKCDRMVRHEIMAAMTERAACTGNFFKKGQDVESRISNAARFVDRSLVAGSAFKCSVEQASLMYDVTIRSTMAEYEALCGLRRNGVEVSENA